METQGINLFIVDDNKLLVADLKNYLNNKFGVSLQISTFYDGESCLEKIDENTHIVILDYNMDGKDGLEVLKLIKIKNPKTEVIMLSSNEDMALAIGTFRAGAKDYILKGYGSLTMISKLVTKIITDPIKNLVKEFGISKYMTAFFLTFVVMGIAVAFALNMMNR
jgi:DNA-binding NarL/FixJ family response regulator